MDAETHKRIMERVESFLNRLQPAFKIIEEHKVSFTFFITAASVILNLCINYLLYIYSQTFAFIWNLDISYVQIDHENTVFSFIVTVIAAIMLLYINFARNFFLNKKFNKIAIALHLAPLAAVVVLSFVSNKNQIAFLYYIYILSVFLFILALFSAGMFIMAYGFYQMNIKQKK